MKESVSIASIARIASENYEPDTWAHAQRVAAYVAQNDMIPYSEKDFCYAVALAHDLIEDTDISLCQFPDDFKKAVGYLTKRQDMSYDDYCAKIKEYSNNGLAGRAAYWVKMADMKDHLSQVDTLTDRLKEKYLSGLRFLL